MHQQSMFFTARVGEKLADVRLQANLRKVKDNFVSSFAAAKRDFNQEADFEALRNDGAAIRKRVLDNLVSGWRFSSRTPRRVAPASSGHAMAGKSASRW